MKKIKSMFEKHDLIKIVSLCILITILLSWIIPYGYFTGTELSNDGIGRQGLADILLSGVYSANFFLQQLLFVIFIGAFYGIISKTSGYKGLVSSIAKKFNGKEKFFVLATSFCIILLTSMISQSFVVLFFVPLIIHIASKLKIDKITAFLSTFGSMIVGILGATYGTEGLVYFVSYLNYYKEVDITTEIGIRFGILALAYFIFSFFTIRHMKNMKKEEQIEDTFAIEKNNKKVKVWPMGLFYIIILAFVILGYVSWDTNFGITIFDQFHTWLTKLAIGKYTIIKYILGNNATAFGTWDLYTITIVLAIILLICSFIYKIKLDDFIDNAMEGIQNIIKPILVLFLVYIIFVIVYWSPFTNTISNWIIKMSKGFNPFLTALSAAISSLFHIDFGYTGYVLGDLMVNSFGDSFNIAFVIYTTMNGLMQIIAPTSVFLLLGLSYLNIPYKKWVKYIWKFFVVMLILLLAVFALLTY